MKIIGVILILWGIADFGLSWLETDLYGEIGINLPSWLYPYTAYIAMGLGYGLYALGGKTSLDEEDEK
jgi:hypothetical protein